MTDLIKAFRMFDAYVDRNFCDIVSPIRVDYNYNIVNSKDGKSAKIYLYALGVKQKDINISIQKENRRDVLIISGQTKREDLDSTFSFQQKIQLRRELDKDIDWYLEDGLLIINVSWKDYQLDHNIKYIGK